MIKVKRENVIYSIPEEEKGDYLKKGYSLLDSNGKEIKPKKKDDNKELETLTKRVEELTTEKTNLESEKADLTKRVEELTKQIEKLSKKDKE